MSGNYQGGINLWNLEKQSLLKKINAHTAPISHITFHDSKNTFLSASKDSTIKLWSFYSHRLIDSIKINNTPTIVLFNNKGNDYFICTEEGLILEKKTSRKTPEIITNTETAISDAFFDAETNKIITCDQNSIKIISSNTGEILNETFIDKLKRKKDKEKAHQYNRRTDFKVVLDSFYDAESDKVLQKKK